tara:strand:- start:6122 stop:6631 length:510 start_codon:yes stop_codon:yes gene_type:complete
MSNQTHYRKAFKSDHLGCADLEDFIESGSNLVFTISHVNQERGAKVAGKKIDANIAYFVENIKPLVLNATNSKTVSKLAGSVFVENWKSIPVQLYIDPSVSMKGQVTGGVRVSTNKIKPRQVITRDCQQWNNAIAAYKRDGNFNAVLSKADIKDIDMQFIADGVASGSI